MHVWIHYLSKIFFCRIYCILLFKVSNELLILHAKMQDIMHCFESQYLAGYHNQNVDWIWDPKQLRTKSMALSMVSEDPMM